MYINFQQNRHNRLVKKRAHKYICKLYEFATTGNRILKKLIISDMRHRETYKNYCPPPRQALL